MLGICLIFVNINQVFLAYCTIFLRTDRKFFSLAAAVVVAAAASAALAAAAAFDEDFDFDIDFDVVVVAAPSSNRVCAAIKCSKTNPAEGIID